MAKLLPFKRPDTTVVSSAVLWAPPPVVSPFGGSLEGATTEEVQQRALEQNPMRALSRMICEYCGHTWQQPAATGRCPKCGDDDTTCNGTIPCMAQRV